MFTMFANKQTKCVVMSRRSIFMLAATVVLLYFSIIVFMLSPLHGASRAYFSTARHRYSMRGGLDFAWCKDLRYRPPGTVVALASYPGSGNTWLRYLLQQVTGIMTGSVYMDYGLRVHGFPAENVTDGTVLVVKTHEGPPVQPDKYKAAILLIRNPRDAILWLSVNCCRLAIVLCFLFVYRLSSHVDTADFNRLHKGHIGTAPKSAFKKKTHEHKKSDWAMYVSSQLTAWQSLHELWLTRFTGRLLVVFYEALVRDTRGSLHEMLDFLNHTVSEADMTCALLNKEGIYRRRKKLQDFDPFTADMYRALEQVRARVLDLVEDYYRRHNITGRARPSIALDNVA